MGKKLVTHTSFVYHSFKTRMESGTNEGHTTITEFTRS